MALIVMDDVLKEPPRTLYPNLFIAITLQTFKFLTHKILFHFFIFFIIISEPFISENFINASINETLDVFCWDLKREESEKRV